MPEDFSRVRDNPLLNYSGVELKQGAVLLDADMNELVAITDRRIRALASDVLGRATVSSTTPDAFKITAGGGSFEIGKGRLYVDGLLAENHGQRRSNEEPAQPLEFDPLMGEPTFAIDPTVSYETQPYLLSPPKLPEPGQHIVYLDVWQRPVTHVEEPDLVEIAVGVETSSRLQIVWQVRVLEVGDDGLSCESEPEAWKSLIAPSTGRLTTGTYEETAAEDPCELPPTGGFRGLENQLYRVEIHKGGLPGEATFTWSRENASLVDSRITSIIPTTELELDTLGRDDFMRFKNNDWVEILNDVREFSQLRGEMRKITSVNETTRRITFDADLPSDLTGSDPSERNLRIRRWDQNGMVRKTTGSGNTANFLDVDANNGVISVPADGSTLLLEDGITVSFNASPDTIGFRAGDYWVFAARTADASVEILNEAPPRGIHHHYARLAILTIANRSAAGRTAEIAVTDCRHSWPPATGDGNECACTQCVTPQSHNGDGTLTIQAAVDMVKNTGGTVCLAPGKYFLKKAIQIERAKGVQIVGHGSATNIITRDGAAFVLQKSADIAIEKLMISSLNEGAAIRVRSVVGLTLEKLHIAKKVDQARPVAAAVEVSGVLAFAAIRGNVIVAPVGIRAVPNVEGGDGDVPRWLIAAAVDISRNVFDCDQMAIDLGEHTAHVNGMRIQNNEFVDCSVVAVRLLGYALPRIGLLGAPGPATQILVGDNSFNVVGSGIQCAVDGAWIINNKLTRSTAKLDPDSHGIKLAIGPDPSGMDQCHVLANQISGFSGSGILIQATIRDLLVKLNIIQQCGNGIVSNARLDSVSIENNHLGDIGTEGGSAGISVAEADAVSVTGNTLRGVGAGSTSANGIVVRRVARSKICGNDLSEIGPKGEGSGAGIVIGAPFNDAQLANNYVSSVTTQNSAWKALLVSERSPIEPTEDAIVVRDGTLSLVIARGRGRVVRGGSSLADGRRIGGVSAMGNTFLSGGEQIARLSVTGHVTFANNRCETIGSSPDGSNDAVHIAGDSAAVSGNHVIGRMSISLDTVKKLTVLGNITRGITVGNEDLGPPWTGLNVVV